jgi:peptidoglycan hydrolase CwlO-like protein
MADDQDKSIKDVEKELEDIKERADKLDKQIKDAEAKHPPKLDHPDDGGVI